MPTDESFMDPCQEALVDGYLRKASTEDIWWAIFRILIPVVEQLDDATRKLLYSPCQFFFSAYYLYLGN